MLLEDKFIAYMDVLGFRSLMDAAEQGKGVTYDDLEAAVRMLGGDDRVRKDPRLQVTQVFDCAVISAAVSPADLDALLAHCWVACLNLLIKGFMCRGFVTRGKMKHGPDGPFGPGHNAAVDGEARVRAFARDTEERGTPFVEIDGAVVDYIKAQNNPRLNNTLKKFTRSDGAVTVLYPYQMLMHPLILTAHTPFDEDRERRANDKLRTDLKAIRERVLSLVDRGNTSATKKAEHYAKFLDDALARCDRTDFLIEAWTTPPALRKARIGR